MRFRFYRVLKRQLDGLSDSPIYWHARGNVSPDDAWKYLGCQWSEERDVVITYRERMPVGMTNIQLGAVIVEGSGEDEIARFFLSLQIQRLIMVASTPSKRKLALLHDPVTCRRPRTPTTSVSPAGT